MGSAGALTSMDTAIDTVKGRSMQCFWFFIVQLVTFSFSSLLLVWLCYDFLVALVVSFVLFGFFVVSMQNGFELFELLFIKDEDATSNKLMQHTDSKVSRQSQNSSESAPISNSPVQLKERKVSDKASSSDMLRQSNSKQHKYEQFFDNF